MTAVAEHTTRHPSLIPVTKSYRVRQAVARDALQNQLEKLWSTFDTSDPLPSIAGIARQSSTWVLGGQQVAAQDAVGYLAQIVAARHGVDPADLSPFEVPEHLVGSTHSGATVGALVNAAPSIYAQRLDLTGDPEAAANSAHAYLTSIAASEPTRVANLTVLHNTQADPRLTGRYFRATGAHPCDFCRLIAERGYTEAHAGFLAHRHCSCTAEPEPAFYRPPTKADVLPPVVHRPTPTIADPLDAAARIEHELANAETRALKAQVAQSIATSPEMEQFSADQIFDAKVGSPFGRSSNAIRWAQAKDGNLYISLDDTTGLIETSQVQSPGWVRADSVEAEAIAKRAACSDLVNTWAQTSNDNDPVALAMQAIAADEFGMVGTAPWRYTGALGRQINVNLATSGDVYRSFLRAQYNATQQQFAREGIHELTVFRGTDQELPVGSAVPVQLRPMSSFATDPDVAQNFAGESVLRMTVPAEDVLSTPLTGNGCKNETEVVVLARRGTYNAAVTNPDSSTFEAWHEQWYQAALRAAA